MNLKRKLLTKMLAALALTLGATMALSRPSEAENRRFFCGTDNHPNLGNVPSTIARSTRGDIPIIIWVSERTNGWTPERRCEHVSQKFQRYYDNGTLKYIRTGNINNHPVICVASHKDGDCLERDVLLTLEPRDDAHTALEQMLDLRRRAGGQPLQLSDGLLFYVNGEAYVDTEIFIDRAPVREIEATNAEEE